MLGALSIFVFRPQMWRFNFLFVLCLLMGWVEGNRGARHFFFAAPVSKRNVPNPLLEEAAIVLLNFKSCSQGVIQGKRGLELLHYFCCSSFREGVNLVCSGVLTWLIKMMKMKKMQTAFFFPNRRTRLLSCVNRQREVCEIAGGTQFYIALFAWLSSSRARLVMKYQERRRNGTAWPMTSTRTGLWRQKLQALLSVHFTWRFALRQRDSLH